MPTFLQELNALPNIQKFEARIPCEDVEYTTSTLSTLQVNVGRLCNLSCKHCHLEAGPNRTEVMNHDVMEACLAVCREQQVETIDITGGAPEMNPHIKWFIGEACKICMHVIVRTNLVVMDENEYRSFPEFYAKNKVEVVCSLPYYSESVMDKVRGAGSFNTAIKMLKQLNSLGYGIDEWLVLNMVYNPAGAFFPPAQAAIEKEYKAKLQTDFGIVFNNLFTITNNPIGRFGEFLKRSGNLTSYMQKLSDAFNPTTLPNLMCRFQISVGYDGTLYDCDFNQAVALPISTKQTIFDLIGKSFEPRKICFANHCYGCTAGQGSSCGGATE